MAIRNICTITREYLARQLSRAMGILFALLASLLMPQPFIYAHVSNLSVLSQTNPGDWPTYMKDIGHSGFNANESVLNVNTVPNLKVHWQYHVGARISSQPVVADGVVYWGSWDGYEHATTLAGQQLWRTFVGMTIPRSGCSIPPAGVAASATVTSISINGTTTSVVIVNGGNAHVYALRASDGSVLWSTAVGTSPDYMLWGGTTVYNGNVYTGVSSFGDCPLVTGKVVQLDASTGNILHSFNTVPTSCRGASVWMTPTIDIAEQALYVSTGNKGTCKTPETLAYALVKLSAIDLSFIDSWQLPAADQKGDNDFGSTPTLFTATISGQQREMIGFVNKDGVYYAFDRSHISAGPIWQFDLSSAPNNIASSAWDGTTLYTAGTLTTIKGKTCKGSVRAHDPATGTVKWEYCAPGKIIASLAAIPGVIFAGANNQLVALNATTGTQLFSFTDTSKQSIFWGCCTVSNGIVYAGNEAGNLFALGV